MSTPTDLDPVAYVAGIRAALEAVYNEPRPHPGGDSIGHTRAADLRAIRDLLNPLPTAHSLHLSWSSERARLDWFIARGETDKNLEWIVNHRLEVLGTYLDKHGLTGTELDPRLLEATK